MFGLEKKKKKLFEFDLEKELKADPKKVKDTLGLVDGKINELKNELRAGSKSEDFNALGDLLNGFNALKKVISSIKK